MLMLAIAVGTHMARTKFTRPPTGDILAIDRIKEIHAALPNTHLVMHGSSSVPQEWLAVINQYGGDIKETYGVPVSSLLKQSNMAFVKSILIPTCVWLQRVQCARMMAENPAEFDPRKFWRDS